MKSKLIALICAGLLMALTLFIVGKVSAQGANQKEIDFLDALIGKRSNEWAQIDADQKEVQAKCDAQISEFVNKKKELEQEAEGLRNAKDAFTRGENK